MNQKPLLAISVMQPWAWLLANGHKDVENRGWTDLTCLGQPILIHAGKDFDREGLASVRELILEGGYEIALPAKFPVGGIVGILRFGEVRPNRYLELSDWAMPDSIGYWVERNADRSLRAQSLPLIHLPGKLGFFAVPPEVKRIVTRLLKYKQASPDIDLQALGDIDPRKTMSEEEWSSYVASYKKK